MDILILDDAFTEATAHYLMHKGHNVVYTETVCDTISYIKSEHPLDLILVQSVPDHDPKTGARFLPLGNLEYVSPAERNMSAGLTLLEFLQSSQTQTVSLVLATNCDDVLRQRPSLTRKLFDTQCFILKHPHSLKDLGQAIDVFAKEPS